MGKKSPKIAAEVVFIKNYQHGRFLMGFEDKYMACRRPFLMLRIKKMEKLITLGSDLYVSIVIICSIQIEEAQMVHGFNIIL